MNLSGRIRAILTPTERKLFQRLHSPSRIQDFLEGIPSNFELDGETNFTPRVMLKKGIGHCFEGAVFAAAVLAYHGHRPLLMDFSTTYDDDDHEVALFVENGLWGAISKTNHSVLRYRDAVYRTPRELAMSFFHEYYMYDRRKSLRSYSSPFDLSRFPVERWITSDESLDWLTDAIACTRYNLIGPPAAMRRLRKATSLEIKTLKLTNWHDPRKKKTG